MAEPRKTPLLLPLVWTAVFLGVLLAHARYWWPFYSDDALISLRYAARLLEGKGLNWNDAPPYVEGYSNLLWTLLVAFLGLFRVDLILASRLLGVAGMTVAIFSVARWQLGRACPRASVVSLGAGLLFFTLAAPTAIWAIGGLEQPLIAALLAVALPLTFRLIEGEDQAPAGSSAPDPSDLSNPEMPRMILALSFVLGLLCITRPDGPLFAVAVFFSLILGRLALRRPQLPLRHLFLYLPLFPVLFYGGQLAFRLAYYGEWVPNTALVKVAPRGVYLERGLDYLASGFISTLPFSALGLLALLACLLAPARRGRAVALLMVSLLWLPYVAYVGGDIHPAHRHLVPMVVVFTFALVDGVDLLLGWIERPSPSGRIPPLKRLARIAVPVLLAAAAFPYLVIQTSHPDNMQVNEEAWVWNGEVTGRLLHRAFAEEQPTVAVTAAGCIPYWSRLPALDMLGLNDHYLPRHPPETVGEGYLGHELGSGDYVLRRAPDIVCFHTGIREGIFRSGGELMQSDAFHELYQPVRFLGREPKEFTATLWMRRPSPKVGVRRAPDEIHVPGYLFQSAADPPAVLNDAGKPVQPLAPGRTARFVLRDSATSAGNWTAKLFPDEARDLLEVELLSTAGGWGITLRNAGDREARLGRLVLLRTGAPSE